LLPGCCCQKVLLVVRMSDDGSTAGVTEKRGGHHGGAVNRGIVFMEDELVAQSITNVTHDEQHHITAPPQGKVLSHG